VSKEPINRIQFSVLKEKESVFRINFSSGYETSLENCQRGRVGSDKTRAVVPVVVSSSHSFVVLDSF